ncbi:AGAP011974-PA-like protein [Anopheles sinensis]|uniref:AGAP011974-PA-like protein n=1 Tax=Anopheles sinensis TaxID=74873 RepID=A0A084W9B3_ANOSI|nr:AGAP011974-PA-like protein [Anopheles sinensis]
MLLLTGKIVLGILWTLSFTDFATSQQQSAARRYTAPRRPMVRQLVSQCAMPYFPNGEAKIRNRGRMIRFDCVYGYKLVGNKYANCNNGRWDTSIPVCAKSGCTTLPNVESGYVLYELNKATAWLSCFDSTELAGSRNTYCNGTHWDRPLGVCRKTGQGTARDCDFEAETMCGWSNDVLHDFDWKRSDGTLNPRALRTGPKYDHTKMQPKAGHFMIVDSAEQFTNDTARFISPLYDPELSIGACFQFYYHMYGETVGSLKVYVKPMTADLYDLKPSLVLEGNQKNIWHEGNIEIPQQSERFQIVFEASLGMRSKSDIAIDDVSLLQGDNCKVAVEDGLENPDDAAPADPEVEPDKISSCENRCGMRMADILNTTDKIVPCDCHEDCVESSSCCPDFIERCVFVVPSVNASSTTTSAPQRVSTISTTAKTVQMSTTSTPSTTTRPTATTSTTVRTTPSTTEKVLTTRTTTTSTARPSTTPRKLPTSTATLTSTTKSYNLRPRPMVPMTNRPRYISSTTSRTTVTTTTRPSSTVTTTKQVPTTVRVTVQPSTVVTTKQLATEPTQSDVVFLTSDVETSTDQLLLASRYANAPFPSETVPPKSNLAKYFIFATVGAVVFLSILCVTYSYARRSRSSVLARLKEKSQSKCFEDIRFLAGDEDLDFNISQASEAVEEKTDTDRKHRGDKSKKSKKLVDTQGKETSAPGVDRKQKTGGQQQDEAGESSPREKAKDSGAASYDSEADSCSDDSEHTGGSKRTSKRSTKKEYQKYVKHYDEDMVSTLL